MKKLVLLFAFIAFAATSVCAQSVKVIPALVDADGLAVPDVIINEMVADTNAAGEQLNDIYMLEANGNYTITQSIVINNPLTLTAPPFDRDDPNAQPPVVRVGVNADGSQACAAACIWILAGANVNISNIYFGGVHLGNGWVNGNLLNPTAPDISIRLDSLIIDYMGWSVLANFDPSSSGVSYYLNDVYVKNAQNPGDPNSPFLFLNTVPVDTLVVQNTTYFQSHGFFIQSRTPINYFRLNHSTVANALKSPIWNLQLTDADITNNIFYNTTGGGFNAAEIVDQDPDDQDWGIVNFDVLAGNEPDAPDSLRAITMPEEERRITVTNNVWYKTQPVLDYMADSLRHDGFMNERTQGAFDDDANYPLLTEENNENLAFSFDNLVEPGSMGLDATEEMINYMVNFRTGGVLDFWGYESDLDVLGVFAPLAIDWPYTESLRHDITMVTDEDGNPIGDLNWYPEITRTSNEANSDIPERFQLAQNYPNPFNPTTNISFTLNANERVSLKVFDVLGREVAVLLDNQFYNAGQYTVEFGADNLPSGVYLYRLEAGNFSRAKSMILLK